MPQKTMQPVTCLLRSTAVKQSLPPQKTIHTISLLRSMIAGSHGCAQTAICTACGGPCLSMGVHTLASTEAHPCQDKV